MRPKRASDRFTRTREDFQIDARSHLFKTPTEYHPIPCGKRGETRFRLELEGANDNTCNLSSLSDELHSAGLTIPVSTLEGYLDTLLEVVPKYILQTGRAVRIGNLVTLKPFITGSVKYANDRPDPDENHIAIQAIPSPALRDALAKAPLVNTARNSNGLDRVMGGQDNTKFDKIDTENTTQIHGKDIYVTPHQANADCGGGRVWIETRDGRRLGACSVELPTGPDLITARFVPDAPMREEDRECRVVVETYATMEAAESDKPRCLFRLTRDVTYIGPVQP